MRRKFVKQIMFAIIFLNSVTVAQNVNDLLPSLPLPNGAILRWFLPDSVLPDGGFRLYRSDGSNEVIIEIDAPQNAEHVVNEGWLSEEEFALLVEVYKHPIQTEEDSLQRALFDIQVTTNPNWARALGILYTDEGLRTGVSYNYRTVAVHQGQEVTLGEAIVTPGPSPEVGMVTNLEAVLLGNQVGLKWLQEDNLVISYHVYRAVDGGDFELLLPDPHLANYFFSEDGTILYDGARYLNEVEPDKLYKYQLAAVDIFGRESALSEEIVVDTAPLRPLPTLAISTHKVLDKQISLTWEMVFDERVEEVLVLRTLNPDNELETIAQLPADTTSFTDTTVVGGTQYYYALATKSTDTTSGRGPMRSIRAVNQTPPTTPSGLTLQAEENAFNLTWQHISEPDLWGYHVLRAESEEATLEEHVRLTSDPLSEARFTDEVPQGVKTRYYYRVLAINTSNVSSQPSEAVSGVLVDITPPPTPVLLNVSGLDGAIGIAWSLAPTPDVKTFEIFRVGPDGRLVFVQAVGAASLGYIDRSVSPNTSYAYAVTAVDVDGNRSDASNSLEARAFLTAPPDIPEGLAATLTDEGVQLEWILADPALTYILYRLTTEGAPIQISGSLEQTTFIDTEGLAGSTYQLRSIDVSGNLSDFSTAVTAK